MILGICGQASPQIQFPTTQAPTTPSTAAPEPSPVPAAGGGESAPEYPIVVPAQPGASEGGKAKIVPEGHIIGGAEALKYSYPWMVALLIDGRHFCGGSLIDNQHVVTAAHCTDKANSVTMLLGTHNIKSAKGVEDGRQIFNITRQNIFQHPDYNGNTITHDISILRLPQPILFTGNFKYLRHSYVSFRKVCAMLYIFICFPDRIKPICLPNRYFLTKFFTDEQTRVSGWGKPADSKLNSKYVEV